MLTIALTGGFAVGKSSFARALRSIVDEQWLIIDEDKWTELVSIDSQFIDDVVAIFGPNAVLDNTFNKVFINEQRWCTADDKYLRAFYQAMLRAWHRVRTELESTIQVVILEIPLFFELSEFDFEVDRVCSIIASARSQRTRGLQRQFMTPEIVADILTSQVDNEFRLVHSHYTYVNEYNTVDTLKSVANHFYNLVMQYEIAKGQSIFH